MGRLCVWSRPRNTASSTSNGSVRCGSWTNAQEIIGPSVAMIGMQGIKRAVGPGGFFMRTIIGVSIPGVVVVAMMLRTVASGEQPEAMHVAAPEFAKVTEWLNSKPLKIAELKGQVAVVHFWTFG